MARARIEIDDERVSVLSKLGEPIGEAARELMVLELYRRGLISSGKAAGLVAMSRLQFIQHASRLGIPYLDMTGDEWADERAASETL